MSSDQILQYPFITKTRLLLICFCHIILLFLPVYNLRSFCSNFIFDIKLIVKLLLVMIFLSTGFFSGTLCFVKRNLLFYIVLEKLNTNEFFFAYLF